MMKKNKQPRFTKDEWWIIHHYVNLDTVEGETCRIIADKIKEYLKGLEDGK